MEVSFAQLRDEALDGINVEPFVIKMPGKAKDVVIPMLPTKLFTAEFDVAGGKLEVRSLITFLKAAVPTKDFERLWPVLEDEPIPVLANLTGRILKHFGLAIEGSDDAGKSEDSSE